MQVLMVGTHEYSKVLDIVLPFNSDVILRAGHVPLVKRESVKGLDRLLHKFHYFLEAARCDDTLVIDADCIVTAIPAVRPGIHVAFIPGNSRLVWGASAVYLSKESTPFLDELWTAVKRYRETHTLFEECALEAWLQTRGADLKQQYLPRVHKWTLGAHHMRTVAMKAAWLQAGLAQAELLIRRINCSAKLTPNQNEVINATNPETNGPITPV